MDRKLIDYKQILYVIEFLNDCVGSWELPHVKRNTLPSLNDLGVIPFDNANPQKIPNSQKIVHFFIDDYKFESVYKYPERHLRKLAYYSHVLSPDFSLYADYPRSVQLLNTFKNRWCGAYWQKLGLSVFPTITWGDEDSFEFCFQGVDKGSIVAISTIGCKEYTSAFLSGYQEMMKQIEPQYVLCFGMPFNEMESNTIYIDCEKFPKKEKNKWVEEAPELGF